MADKVEPTNGAAPKKAMLETVAPTNLITVAFPFSHISMGKPEEELREMAGLLEELSDLVVKAAPGPKATALRRRAHDLAARVA